MFQGSMVAIVTPMLPGVAPNTPLDSVALEELVEWHIASGTDAIVAVGTTGESATLNMEEHVEVIRQIVRFVNQRIPVIAGTGANSTTEAIELTQAALSLCSQQGDRHREAALLNNLADLLHTAGREVEAKDYLRKSVVIFAEIGVEAGEQDPEIWKLSEW